MEQQVQPLDFLFFFSSLFSRDRTQDTLTAPVMYITVYKIGVFINQILSEAQP